MYHYLYKITNLINNKIYIGIHSTENIDDGYMGSGKRIKAAIQKYGIDNFSKEILSYYPSLDEALIAEKETVTEDFCKRADTYNIAIGGCCGGSLVAGKSEEERKHWIANISKGCKRSFENSNRIETYRKLRNSKEFNDKFKATRAKTEQNMTDEQKEQRSKFFKEVHNTPLAKKHHAEATKRRWSTMTEEEKEKQINNNRLSQLKEETQKSRSEKLQLHSCGCKKVLYDNQEFHSKKAAWKYAVKNGYIWGYSKFVKSKNFVEL